MHQQQGAKLRVALDFAIGGDLRYLAHQETLRMFARACVRAGLPVRSTEGFSPHPRISLPLPRPVGVASNAERVVIEITEPLTPSGVRTLLAPHLPEGLTMLQARMLEPHDRCMPRRATYRVALDAEDPRDLSARAARLMRFAPVFHDRFVHKQRKFVRMDLRPYLDSIVVADRELTFTTHITGGGAVKPAEVCGALGLSNGPVNHRILRTEVAWRQRP